jgi:preprotein translocase subunit YajC
MKHPTRLFYFLLFMCFFAFFFIFYFTAVRQASRQAKTFRKKKGKLRPCGSLNSPIELRDPQGGI